MDNTAFSYWINKTTDGKNFWFGYQKSLRESIMEFRKELADSDDFQKIVKEKLKELREDLMNLNIGLRDLKSKPNHFIYDLFIEELEKRVKKCRMKLRKFQNYRREETDMVESIPDHSFNLTKLKDIPIALIMDREPSRSDMGRDVYFCPFHEEHNPSFTVYKEENTFFCFSCQEWGDVIALYQKLYSVDFIAACKELDRMS